MTNKWICETNYEIMRLPRSCTQTKQNFQEEKAFWRDLRHWWPSKWFMAEQNPCHWMRWGRCNHFMVLFVEAARSWQEPKKNFFSWLMNTLLSDEYALWNDDLKVKLNKFTSNGRKGLQSEIYKTLMAVQVVYGWAKSLPLMAATILWLAGRNARPFGVHAHGFFCNLVDP